MSFTREIPDTALPIVEILRRDVPKPDELPTYAAGALRWNEFRCACPMGLHPQATSPVPVHEDQFPPYPNGHIVRQFAVWWDNQKDAKAAVNAIWPV